MAEQFNPVDFNELSATSDGKTLLYADGQVCKSDNTLGQLIDGKINVKGYASETFVNGKIEDLSGTVSTEYATKEELGKVGNFIVKDGDVDGKPNLNPSVAETKSIYLVKDEQATTPDQYREWIVTENEQEEKVWTCIGDTTIDLSDYALSADVNAELALKEDKVFIAEYNVTTYAAIKAAYDAGKQIVCIKHTDGALQYVYATLSQNIEGVLFIFNSGIAAQDYMFICKYNNGETLWEEQLKHYYDTTATSGSEQLSAAFKANNITTAVKWGGSISLQKDGTQIGVILSGNFDSDFDSTHGTNTIKLIGEDANNGTIGTLSLSPTERNNVKNMCLYHNTTEGQENWYFVPSPIDNGVLENNNGSITWASGYQARITQLENTISNLTTLLESYSGRWVLTPEIPTVTIGGKTYRTVTIGNQEWMAENLDLSGGWLGKLTGNNLVSPQGSYNNWDEANSKYGILYNWAAVTYMNDNSASIGIPEGWRIPTKTDLQTLVTCVGSGENPEHPDYVAGKYLKTASEWNYNPSDPRQEIDETFGFSATPAGQYVGYSTNFYAPGGYVGYWSKTQSTDSQNNAYFLPISINGREATINDYSKDRGYSVRLVRDIT